MTAQWQNSRGIEKRLIIQGTLVLDTPAHIGNGDTDGPLDMPLMRDGVEGKALLTGATIAGALRSYLKKMRPVGDEELLFGKISTQESDQSLMIVDDAIGDDLPLVELRDGVAIDSLTHTAEDKKKFDIELLCAGSTFPLSFEVLIPKGKGPTVLTAVGIALQGFENGNISLGKRKSRGYGRCHVSGWKMVEYDMTQPPGFVAWLDGDRTDEKEGIAAFLFSLTSSPTSLNMDCRLEATFKVSSSLLIRSGSGRSSEPDMVHLRSKRLIDPSGQAWEEVPILSGTSLAGALRDRIGWIASTVGLDGRDIANHIFGFRPTNDDPSDIPLTASRLWVDECVIENPLHMVNSRLKIDRFTGGAYSGALFDEQPVYGGQQTCLKISLVLHKAEKPEIGLLLMALKDLWTGDLTVGGERGVGRGRLRGIGACLTYLGEIWNIFQEADDTITVSGPDGKDLQTEFVEPFKNWRQS